MKQMFMRNEKNEMYEKQQMKWNRQAMLLEEVLISCLVFLLFFCLSFLLPFRFFLYLYNMFLLLAFFSIIY